MNRFKFCTLSLSILVSIGVGSVAKGNAGKAINYRLILPDFDFPNSYDPLEADFVSNSDIMKLRYLTPIEIDQNDKFKSTILKTFEYDSKTFTATWKVRSDLKYADGTVITTSDILLAIKRMAMKRPEFPVLSSIKGLAGWSKSQNPLDQDIPGVKQSGDSIVIQFDRNVPNPLFQFSLPLFAIQPSSCFEKKTGKLICSLPPASGYYDFAGDAPQLDKKSDKKSPIKFALRQIFQNDPALKMPGLLTLEYSNSSMPDLVGSLDEHSVARTIDSRLTDEFINQFRDKVDIKRLPKTAIGFLLLNPNFEAFKEKICRRIFVNKLRVIYSKEVDSSKITTKSFSSPIMPGYLTNEELEKRVPTEESKNCYEIFKKHPVKFLSSYPFWDKLLIDTMTAVGMPTTGMVKTQSRASLPERNKSFVANETAFVTSSVSFWPLDLAAGFKMFFAPNMHESLKYLVADGQLTDLSDKLFAEPNPAVSTEYYEKINVLLYEGSQLNPLSYFGDAYISKSTKLNQLPIATSVPSPWHFFKMK